MNASANLKYAHMAIPFPTREGSPLPQIRNSENSTMKCKIGSISVVRTLKIKCKFGGVEEVKLRKSKIGDNLTLFL
jgi:hypothetical protein